MSATELDILIRDIRSAFHGVERGNISLHQARLLDDVMTPSIVQLAEAGAKDADAHWEEVPDAFLEALSDALRFLDAAGRRYYLPRFMIYAIRPPVTSTWENAYAVDAAFEILMDLDFYRSEFDAFTCDQAGVVARFLQHMSNEGYTHFTLEDQRREVNATDEQPVDMVPIVLRQYWNPRARM